MAKLTKFQQEELNTLREERDIARALSWPNFPAPTPMLPPERWDETIHGWWFITHSQYVKEGWRKGDTFYHDSPREDQWNFNGSRSCEPLYATEHEAYLALYHALCREYGEKLAAVLHKAEATKETA